MYATVWRITGHLLLFFWLLLPKLQILLHKIPWRGDANLEQPGTPHQVMNSCGWGPLPTVSWTCPYLTSRDFPGEYMYCFQHSSCPGLSRSKLRLKSYRPNMIGTKSRYASFIAIESFSMLIFHPRPLPCSHHASWEWIQHLPWKFYSFESVHSLSFWSINNMVAICSMVINELSLLLLG